MTTQPPRYLIFPSDTADAPVLSLALCKLESDYLENVVSPLLRPLAEAHYIEGPQGILQTLARYSYVLVGKNVLWCVEWKPGLLVIEFSPNGSIRWCALRSPIPEFGGRVATEEELSSYDEDRPNPQYDLVFTAWDAQVGADCRDAWTRATADEIACWEGAMARANWIGRQTSTFSAEEQEALLGRCKESDIWRGTTAHG
jgi:hypothetical protein